MTTFQDSAKEPRESSFLSCFRSLLERSKKRKENSVTAKKNKTKIDIDCSSDIKRTPRK